jgi:hypothetical protein
LPFVGPRLTVQEDGDKHWLLTAPLHYQGAVDFFTVPSGFRTDFASVPRIFQSLVPATGRWTKAAVLHDWLVKVDNISPRDADGIFRRVLREEGVGPVTRWLMWAGVRWGALANPARRRGWLLDAPALLAITAGVLAVAVAALYALGRIVHLIGVAL